MITQFKINNFKSHSTTDLDLANINILTGLNGMGKSSVIQALTLLRQSFQKSILKKGLELQGDFCKLGNIKDTLYQSSENDLISFEIFFDKTKNLKTEYKVDELKLSDTFLKCSKYENNLSKQFKSLSLFNKNFQYISAYRNGPVDDYEKNTLTVEINHQISKIEGRCEMIAHYLFYFQRDKVNINLAHSDTSDLTLLAQTKKWLEEISPGIDIHIEQYDSSFKISYSFSRGSGNFPTNQFKAKNTGFGVSYTLPIIVAALHSPKDSLVIIENPEAHIHPDGQAKLMELLCKSAKNGVQFVIETHSDHIINGLLLGTKKEILEPEESNVYFFDRNLATHSTKAIHLSVSKSGKIKQPPEGFFDRIEKDMKNLMGF